MSSMSTVQRAVGPVNWANSNLKTSYQDPAAYGCKKWNDTNTYFNSGLPTPPFPKAMPGVVLGNSYAGYPVSTYQQDRGSLRDSTNGSQLYRGTSTTSTNNSYALAPPPNGSSHYERRATDQNDANAIAPHLQIPESVNKSKGSLAEF